MKPVNYSFLFLIIDITHGWKTDEHGERTAGA